MTISANDLPSSGQALNGALRQALDWIKAGQFRPARDLLDTLSGPSDERIDLLKAHALAGSHEPVQAAILFCAFAHRYPTAIHPAHEMIALLAVRNRRDDAEPILQEIVARTPEDGRAHEILGDLLIQMGRLQDAEAALHKAIALRPDSLSGLNLMAACLSEQGRMADADAVFRSALTIRPDDATTLANRGGLLSAENDSPAALEHFRAAIARNPDDPRIRLNHSIALLKAGHTAQGWVEHEWRLRIPGRASLPRDRLMPTLTPDLDLSGRRILLTQEEGLGDMLMYMRYLPPLIERGAQVTVRVPDTLAGLVRRIPGVHRVINPDHAAPDHDWHCPFVSLPRVFADTQDPMGMPAPYLTAAPERIRQWRLHVPANGRPNVGLVWAGAPHPDITDAHILDRKRSMRLSDLAPLADIPGLNLISLQKGPATAEMADMPENMRLYDPMEDVRDMHDTAALIMSLDVVASVDTSIVHLAGALGRPVILMDRYDNCWRWLSGREDSIWYPTVRIVRQTRPRIWHDVAVRTANILNQLRQARTD